MFNKNIFVVLFFVLTASYPLFSNTTYDEEAYVVKKGETLSGLLYERGITEAKSLYEQGGWVDKNKNINPGIEYWEKLKPGTVVKLVYRKAPEAKIVYQKDLEEKTVDVKKADTKVEEIKPEEKVLGHFLENRFLLGFGVADNKEIQTTQTVNDNSAVTFPILQYQMYYRPTSELDASSWEYRFLVQIDKGLKTRGVNMPFGGQVEIGFGRHSLFKFGTTRFNPNIDLSFDINNTITSDVNDNLSARERQVLWLGLKPELVSYIGSTMMEYYPFLYKSLYMKSMSDTFSGWKFGLRTNVGIAFNNSLYGSFEYNYERHNDKTPLVVISLHNFVFGIGYRF